MILNYFSRHVTTQHIKQKGFTLLEIGISLTIIAIITAGVVATSKMKDSIALQSIVIDMQEISKASTHFRKKYKAMPGDLWNASNFFGGGAVDTLAAVTNGDGDDAINGSEYLYFWQHLALAGLIEGNYDASTNEPDIGVMSSIIPDVGYYVTSTVSDRGRYLTIGIAKYADTDTDGTIERLDSEDRIAFLSPEDAWKLDDTFDDGNPSTGFLSGLDGNGASGACLNNNGTGGNLNDDFYEVSNTGIACILEVNINDNLRKTL